MTDLVERESGEKCEKFRRFDEGEQETEQWVRKQIGLGEKGAIVLCGEKVRNPVVR